MDNYRRRDPFGSTNCALHETYGFGIDQLCASLQNSDTVLQAARSYGCLCNHGFVRKNVGQACVPQSKCCENRVNEEFTYGNKDYEETCENRQPLNYGGVSKMGCF